MDHPQRSARSSISSLDPARPLRLVRQSIHQRPLRWIVVGYATGIALCATLWLAMFFASILNIRADVASLRAIRASSASTITPLELRKVGDDSKSMHANLTRIVRMTTLPFGAGHLVELTPWLGVRYRAATLLIRGGLDLSDAGMIGANLGAQALAAYQSTGATEPTGANSTTWLDVIQGDNGKIDRMLVETADAQRQFALIDRSVLPTSAQGYLARFDTAFRMYQQSGLADPSSRQALMRGLGADGPVRYLILFQNPAELRPSGGFPGTMALVSFDRGQLMSYQIFDGHTLTDAYIAQRTSKRPEPWPIDHYFPQDGFLLHDTGWYADFPTAASTLMSMYAETDWPPINGVIAVQPTIAADLLQVTGPLDVDIDGEMRLVSASNVYDEIERQRRLIVEGIKPWDKTREVHKEALADIGQAIAERMKSANQEQLVHAARLLKASADVRDIQAYASDPGLQTIIDQRGWSGRLQPEAGTSTLAVTFANVALQKTSEFMRPTLTLTSTSVQGNVRTVSLEIDVDNTGPFGQDPLYSGYQDWWLQVGLPTGATRISSSMDPQPDPEAPNGGSYAIGINPQQLRHVTVTFTLPANESFLIRRQPGLTDAQVVIVDQECGQSTDFQLDRDHLVDLSATCAP